MRRSRFSFLLCFFLLPFLPLGTGLRCQQKFVNMTRYNLPWRSGGTYSLALGDLTGDGLPDLVVGSSSKPSLFFNAGPGRFRNMTPRTISQWWRGDNYAVLLFDADGDGDLDILFGKGPRVQNRLYLNDGKGGFKDVTAVLLPQSKDYTRDLAAGDLDGDGDQDVLVGNDSGNSKILVNYGTKGFKDETASRISGLFLPGKEIQLVDLDGDKDLDILLAGILAKVYLNNGKGVFQDSTSALFSPSKIHADSFAVGDVDGDGDPDILFAWSTAPLRLFLNDGKGKFSEAPSSNLPAHKGRINDLALADFDGNGSLDILAATGGSYPEQKVLLFTNDGKGRFTDRTAELPGGADVTKCLAVGDIDGDGAPDAVIGNFHKRNRLWINDGRGKLLDLTDSPFSWRQDAFMSLALADVDRDGDLDVVLGSTGSSATALYYNDGNGNFLRAGPSSFPGNKDHTYCILPVDTDGDGDLDLFLGSSPRDKLYLSDGKGGFKDVSLAALPSLRNYSRAAAAGDLDGDGKPELILAKYGQNVYLANNGYGGFADATSTHLPPLRANTYGLALGDVDGDGDLDLVTANYKAQDRLYLNSGKGRFLDGTAGRLPSANDPSTSVALGDVDGDGDLDLVVGLAGTYGGQNRLLLNDGKGKFSDATKALLPSYPDSTYTVLLEDVDGDGDLDILFGNTKQDRICLNDGKGRFTDATAAMFPAKTGFQDGGVLGAGDLDGDGDIDIISRDQGLGFWRNTLRQVDAVFAPRMGNPYDLDIYGPRGASAVLLLSPLSKKTPMPPFGTLGVDPAFLLAFYAGSIPSSGKRTLSFPVPRDSALAGVRLFFQSLIVGPGPLTASRFTNLFADRIRWR